MVSARSLAARWNTTDGQQQAVEIFERLASRQPLTDLDLPLYDGLVDLRGISVPSPGVRHAGSIAGWDVQRLTMVTSLKHAQLSGIDFSSATLAHLLLSDSLVEECRFDGANCSDLGIWRTRFINSSFRRANLKGATLGSGSAGGRNTWTGIDFSKANLVSAVVQEAVFNKCEFHDARMNGLEFRHCEINACRFSGTMKDVLFECRELSNGPASPPLCNVDLARAQLELCDFRGCEFIDSTFPDDSDILVIANFPAKAEQALSELALKSTEAARSLRAYLRHALHGPPMSPESVFLLNRRDLLGYAAGAELVELAEDLLRDD